MSEPWLSTHLERWPTAKLVPYARNARTHSAEQVAQIAASIVEFGFTNPILAGSDGVIVAGHGRLAAAQKLGLDTVPVVVLDHLTPTQRRALIIADNRIAENAGWDDAMLRIELQSLQEDGFNMDITGFDADALAEIMAGEETTVDGQTDDDAVTEVSAIPISRPGDVWELGKHRLVCGDATDLKSYELLMADAQADMVQFPYAGVYHKLGRIESPKETASYSDGVTTFSRQDKQATLVKSGVTQLTCELK